MPSRSGKSKANGNSMSQSFTGTGMDSSDQDHAADGMMDTSNGSFFGDGSRRRSAADYLLPSLSGNGPDHGDGDHDNEFTAEELLEQIVNPYIEDDSPAAAALRANAEIHIGKMSKVARSINAQALRKFVKRASMRNHFGKVKGKPPRVPPGMRRNMGDQQGGDMDASFTGSNFNASFNNKEQATNIYGITEEGEYSDSQDGEGGEEEGEEGAAALEGTELAELENRSHVSERTSMSKESKSTMSSSVAPPDKVDAKVAPSPKSPRRGKAELQFKEPTPNVKEHPGDHLRLHLQQIDKEGSLRNLVTDDKDVPAEVIEGTVEAGTKVMKSVDPHGILKLTRWRRKKKKGSKKDRKSYVTGKVIDGQHELYTQSIAVMLGVRTSIARTNALITADKHKKRWILPKDFWHTEKYEFRPGGSETTPPHQLSHTFKFKDYSPVVFSYLRRLFGINEFDFLLSVCGNANFIEFISNAKSGQFFFYSSDGKYMIKTMTNAESRFLRRILPDYFRHCCANPNTMLTRFCGMYRVKLYHLRRNVKFVIMTSVFYTDKHLQEFYDLKGSIAGRTAKPGEQVLKDNDLRERLPEGALAMPPQLRERVRRQLIRDCNFLQKNGIMDYSMLVGVHRVPIKQPGTENAPRSTRASTRRMSLTRLPNANASGDSHDNTEAGDSPLRASISPSSGHRQITENFGVFDDVLDEDESSYLEGSEMRPSRPVNSPVQSINIGGDIESKKSQTIEQIYWPFHRLHDIHGNRRMRPGPCYRCRCIPCQCKEDVDLLRKYSIPEFVAPLSDRKDGGFAMDTTGLELPLKCDGQVYEGKIFYLGVIDILQEYNSRKVVESRYRMLQGMDALEASCVAPKDYAARFVKFFDMYSQRIGKKIRVKPSAATAQAATAQSPSKAGRKHSIEEEGVEVEYQQGRPKN